MTLPVRKRWIILLAALIFVICLPFLFYAIVNSYARPYLRRTVAESIASSVKGRCIIKDIGIAPLLSISIGDLQLEIPTAHRSAMSVQVSHASASCRLVPLLGFLKTVMAKDSATAKANAQDRDAGPSILGVIKSFSLSGGKLTLIDGKDSTLSSGGIALSVKVDGRSAQGTLAADSLSIAGLLFRHILSPVAVGDDTVRVSKIEARAFDGTIEGAAAISLKTARISNGTLSIDKINIKKLHKAFHGEGDLSGRLGADLTIAGSVVNADSLRVSGPVRLSDVKISSLAVQKSIIRALLLPGLDTLKFSKGSGRIAITSQRFRIDTLDAEGNPMRLVASGWIGFQNAGDLRLKGTFDRTYVKRLSDIVGNSLDPAENGGRSFSCRIWGPMDNPKIEIARSIVNRTVQNVFESMRQEFKQYMRK
jgi:hypothetical protein